MDFLARLKQANSRLKSAKIKLRIEAKGDRLVLRGTLPDISGLADRQQRIYTGLSATPIGLQEAERKAKQCHVELETGKFEWENWRQREPSGDTCKDWIERLEKDYFARRERNPKTETTWGSRRLFSGVICPLTSSFYDCIRYCQKLVLSYDKYCDIR